MMDTTIRREEPSGQTSTLYTVPVTVIPEITSTFNTTTPLPPPFFNPLPHQAIPTLTPTASEVTTSFPTLPDFAEEALVDRREYIDLIDTSVRAIIKEEVSSQLPQILPQAVSEFATPMIERNITESLEAAVLVKSSSQPKSAYKAAASLSEFELTKILMDKIEEQKSYLRANYKRELYDALVKSYNTNKDLFDTYGEVFTLKRSRDDKDKDQDPSTRSDQGTKRRKSSKDVESSRDPKSKESKSTSSSKGTSRSQHKSSGKSAHTEEPSHIVGDSRVQQNQEFDMGNIPTTPDPDWNKRQHVDFRPPQTWISNIARAENPPTSFDELMDTPIDFSALMCCRVVVEAVHVLGALLRVGESWWARGGNSAHDCYYVRPVFVPGMLRKGIDRDMVCFTIIDGDDIPKDVVLDMKFAQKFASCQMFMKITQHPGSVVNELMMNKKEEEKGRA
ncbi:hypothetical protein Tco_1300372 [Tanacetum coccineum]